MHCEDRSEIHYVSIYHPLQLMHSTEQAMWHGLQVMRLPIITLQQRPFSHLLQAACRQVQVHTYSDHYRDNILVGHVLRAQLSTARLFTPQLSGIS